MAQRWMHQLKYRCAKRQSGQYVDGHEREDVVSYRQKVFLPALAPRMNCWAEIAGKMVKAPPEGRSLIVWVQDETTYYAYDRQKTR